MHNLVTQLLRFGPGPGPVRVLLAQEHRDLGVGRGLRQQRRGAGEGDVGGDGVARAGGVGGLEGVLVDVARCGRAGGRGEGARCRCGGEEGGRAEEHCLSGLRLRRRLVGDGNEKALVVVV